MNIKNKILKALSILAFALSFSGMAFAQTALTQTTLSAAVTGPSFYSGTTPSYQTVITLASTTGISAPTLPGTPVSVIYVDREAMGVLNVNATTGQLGVLRGYLGTQAAPHQSGQMVLVAPQYQNTLQYGANPMPSGLFQQDPPLGSSCTAAGTPATPWVNVLTGAQWLCSSVTNTWVAGWNNPYATDWSGPTANVASAAGAVTPSGPSFQITGAAAVTGFNTATGGMIGFDATSVGYGCFNVIGATGNTATWTNAGNIALGGTFTPNKMFTFCWNPATQKFYPSAIS